MYLLIASIAGEENSVAQLLCFLTHDVFVKTYQVINESLTFYWVSTA